MNTAAKQEIMRLLNKGVAPPEIVHIIVKEPSAQRQRTLALALQECWRTLENTFDERAVYKIDERWESKWPGMQETIQALLERAKSAPTQTTPPTPPTCIINPTKTTRGMKKKKSEKIQVTNHFYAPIGNYVEYLEQQHLHFDKDMRLVATEEPASPVEAPTETKSERSTKQEREIDPSSLIFLPEEQNRSAVELLLKETLSISKKKSVVCRKLYQQRALYNLHQQDDSTKANIINAWAEKFALVGNFKSRFTRKDFGLYYGK
jgi:hypothetical protein